MPNQTGSIQEVADKILAGLKVMSQWQPPVPAPYATLIFNVKKFLTTKNEATQENQEALDVWILEYNEALKEAKTQFPEAEDLEVLSPIQTYHAEDDNYTDSTAPVSEEEDDDEHSVDIPVDGRLDLGANLHKRAFPQLTRRNAQNLEDGELNPGAKGYSQLNKMVEEGVFSDEEDEKSDDEDSKVEVELGRTSPSPLHSFVATPIEFGATSPVEGSKRGGTSQEEMLAAVKLALIGRLNSENPPDVISTNKLPPLADVGQTIYCLIPQGLYQVQGGAWFEWFTADELRANNLLVTQLDQLKAPEATVTAIPTSFQEKSILTLLARGLPTQQFVVTGESINDLSNWDFNTFYRTPAGLFKLTECKTDEYYYYSHELFSAKQLSNHGWLSGIEEGAYDLSDISSEVPVTLIRQIELPFVDEANPAVLYLTAQGLHRLAQDNKSFELLLDVEKLAEYGLLTEELAGLAPLMEVNPPTILEQLLHGNDVSVVMQATLPDAESADVNTFYLTADGVYQQNADRNAFNLLIHAATLQRHGLLTDELTELKSAAKPRLWAMRQLPTDIEAFGKTLPIGEALTAQHHIVTPEGLYQYNETSLNFTLVRTLAELHAMDFDYDIEQLLEDFGVGSESLETLVVMEGDHLPAIDPAQPLVKPRFVMNADGLFQLGAYSEAYKQVLTTEELGPGIKAVEIWAACKVAHETKIGEKAIVNPQDAVTVYSVGLAQLDVVKRQTLTQAIDAKNLEKIEAKKAEQGYTANLQPSHNDALVLDPGLLHLALVIEPKVVNLNAASRYRLLQELAHCQKTSLTVDGHRLTQAVIAERPLTILEEYPQIPAQLRGQAEQLRERLELIVAELLEISNAQTRLKPLPANISAPVTMFSPPQFNLSNDEKEALEKLVKIEQDFQALSAPGADASFIDVNVWYQQLLALEVRLHEAINGEMYRLEQGITLLQNTDSGRAKEDIDRNKLAVPRDHRPMAPYLELSQLEKVKGLATELNDRLQYATPQQQSKMRSSVGLKSSWMALTNFERVPAEQVGQEAVNSAVLEQLDLIVARILLEGAAVQNGLPANPSTASADTFYVTHDGLFQLNAAADGYDCVVTSTQLLPWFTLSKALAKANITALTISHALPDDLAEGQVCFTNGGFNDTKLSVSDTSLLRALVKLFSPTNNLYLAADVADVTPVNEESPLWLMTPKGLFERTMKLNEDDEWVHSYSESPVLSRETLDELGSLDVFLSNAETTGFAACSIHGEVPISALERLQKALNERPEELYRCDLVNARQSALAEGDETIERLNARVGLPVSAPLNLPALKAMTALVDRSVYFDDGFSSIQKDLFQQVAPFFAQNGQSRFESRNHRMAQLARRVEAHIKLHDESGLHTEASIRQEITALQALQDISARCDQQIAEIQKADAFIAHDIAIEINKLFGGREVVGQVTVPGDLAEKCGLIISENNLRLQLMQSRQLGQLSQRLTGCDKIIIVAAGGEVPEFDKRKTDTLYVQATGTKFKQFDEADFLVRSEEDEEACEYEETREKYQVLRVFTSAQQAASVLTEAQCRALAEQVTEWTTGRVIEDASSVKQITAACGLTPLAQAVTESGSELLRTESLRIQTSLVELDEERNPVQFAQAHSQLQRDVERLDKAVALCQASGCTPDIVCDAWLEQQFNKLQDLLNSAADRGVAYPEIDQSFILSQWDDAVNQGPSFVVDFLNSPLYRVLSVFSDSYLSAKVAEAAQEALAGIVTQISNVADANETERTANRFFDQYEELQPKVTSFIGDSYTSVLQQRLLRDVDSWARMKLLPLPKGLRTALTKGPINPSLIAKARDYIETVQEMRNADRFVLDEAGVAMLRNRLSILQPLTYLSESTEGPCVDNYYFLDYVLCHAGTAFVTNTKVAEIDELICHNLSYHYSSTYAGLARIAHLTNVNEGVMASWPDVLDGLDLSERQTLLEQLSFQLLRAMIQQLGQLLAKMDRFISAYITVDEYFKNLDAFNDNCIVTADGSSLPRLPLDVIPELNQHLRVFDHIVAMATSANATASRTRTAASASPDEYDRDFPDDVKHYQWLKAYCEKNPTYDEKLVELTTALEGMEKALNQSEYARFKQDFERVVEKMEGFLIRGARYAKWFIDHKDNLTTGGFNSKIEEGFSDLTGNLEGVKMFKQVLSTHLCDHIPGKGAQSIVDMLKASNKLTELMGDGKPHGFYRNMKIDPPTDRTLTAEAVGETLTITSESKYTVPVVGGATSAATKEVSIISETTMVVGNLDAPIELKTTVPRDSGLDLSVVVLQEAENYVATIEATWRNANKGLSEDQFRELIGQNNLRVPPAQVEAFRIKAESTKAPQDIAQHEFVSTVNYLLRERGFGTGFKAEAFERAAPAAAAEPGLTSTSAASSFAYKPVEIDEYVSPNPTVEVEFGGTGGYERSPSPPVSSGLNSHQQQRRFDSPQSFNGDSLRQRLDDHDEVVSAEFG